MSFRVWDTAQREMYYSDSPISGSFAILSGGHVVFINRDGYAETLPHRVIALQNTGLKDKNGVDVYEGDVVEIPDYYNGIGVVIYAALGFVLDDGKGGICDEWLHWENSLKVVGNIHSNPELIKAVKDSGRIVIRRNSP